MAVIPWVRVVVFTFLTLFSIVVLCVCAFLKYIAVSSFAYVPLFVPLGLAAGCVTAVSLPLFLGLGNLPFRVFTSSIVFEIIWFFILWVLWVGIAGNTVAEISYLYAPGCVELVFPEFPSNGEVCNNVGYTVVEVFSFLNFVCAFIYYDVIFLYAIINAVRGRSIWTRSVKEAAIASGTSPAGEPVCSPTAPQFNMVPTVQYQNYGGYPLNNGTPPTFAQPYNAVYPQLAPIGAPYVVYPQQVLVNGPGAQQQFGAYPQQVPLASGVYPGQYPPSSTVEQTNQAGHSNSLAPATVQTAPSSNSSPPKYASRVVNSSEVPPLTLLDGHRQGQQSASLQQVGPLPSPYGSS